MNEEAKKVFISYSWAVQEQVIELAERLIANGVEVILDVYDLKDGNDKYVFMEQSVNDPTVDHVLIICDKTYTEKANNRTGGVGDETVIITPEIYGNTKQEKFIPIIFEKDEYGKAYCPAYIKSRIYIDLSNEVSYESEYEKLLRDIYNKPKFRKPALGKKPEWLENETVDLSAIRDLIKQVRGYTGSNQIKADFLLRKATDEFVIAAKQYVVPQEKPLDEAFLLIVDQEKSFRDLFIDYCEALIYSGLSLVDAVAPLFEKFYNELHNAKGKGSYRDSDFDLIDFIIWELFVDTTALLIHYERYKDIYELLVRPYFLRCDFFNETVDAYGYYRFRTHSKTIEDICKPKSSNPNRFTMAGDMIIGREKKPVLTKETISNADIVLYQLGTILNIPTSGGWRDYWFPTTYVYHAHKQLVWQKLKSKSHCKKVLALFGVNSIDQMKELIKGSTTDRDMKYSGAWECAPGILSSIKLDEIGTMN